MLIVMVLSSAVFGWWVHRSREWIRQRHEWMAEYRESFWMTFNNDQPRAPFGLWLFGEVGRQYITVHPAYLDEASKLFPEAEVRGEPRLPKQ
jgi:hypothetical protein